MHAYVNACTIWMFTDANALVFSSALGVHSAQHPSMARTRWRCGSLRAIWMHAHAFSHKHHIEHRVLHKHHHQRAPLLAMRHTEQRPRARVILCASHDGALCINLVCCDMLALSPLPHSSHWLSEFRFLHNFLWPLFVSRFCAPGSGQAG